MSKLSLLTSREAPWSIRLHHGHGTAFSRSPPSPSRYRLISVRNSDPTKRSELNGTEREALTNKPVSHSVRQTLTVAQRSKK
ncbi:hypothetical protein CDAR_272071 [Caerostris darwini]|uniref:Uncharacterized protein n=1 Tax=Caerostris darwini TaxID=1538125 RepID=A0AAV4W0H2_9ARAC|nr:hypothetical protein CDAR_272071 [Caerostris darwini]